jgi:hypothetical protein
MQGPSPGSMRRGVWKLFLLPVMMLAVCPEGK